MSAYTDYQLNDGWIRTFDSNENELEWHRDEKDREIEVLEGSGWLFQFDDDLPFFINRRNTVFIPKNVFHRLHKGIGKLTLKIKEL